MPHLVLDKLFYLVNPLRLENSLLDRLDRYHQPSNILNKNIVTSD